LKTQLPLQYPVGIEDLYICFIDSEDGQDKREVIPTYEAEVTSQTNITKVGIAGNNAKFEKWASNQLVVSITRNTKYTLTFDLAGLSIAIKDKMLGITREKGVNFENGEPITYPKFALGVVFPLNDNTKVARWYPRCQLTPAEENYQTLTEGMDIPDQQYVIEALPLLSNGNTKVDFWDGDESNQTAKLTVEQFMQQVICDKSQLDTIQALGGE
jgi:phi13 family phage major tail protein